MVKGNDYKINLVYNNKEIMTSKMNVKDHILKAKINLDFLKEYKGTVYFNYDTVRISFEITIPQEWFVDNKSVGLKYNVKPKPLFWLCL